HIIVVDTGTREVAPHSIAYLPHCFRDEVVRVEIWQPLSRVPIYEKRASVVRVIRHIYICIKGAKKRVIVVLIECDRLTCGKCSDSGEFPASSETLCNISSADKVIEGQLYGVAGDQVMRNVKARQCVGLSRIQRIRRIKGIRTVIQRLLKGISDEEVQVFFVVLQSHLQRVEAGSDCCLHVRVAVEVDPESRPRSLYRLTARGGVNRVFTVWAASCRTGCHIRGVT